VTKIPKNDMKSDNPAAKTGPSPKAEDQVINSVTEAIDLIQDRRFMRDIGPTSSARGGDEAFGIWFRGHDKASFTLTPSVLRRPQGNARAFIDEVSLGRHFQTMNPDASPRDASDFERLVMMQHYQAPTRMLDWSENLLVALYFAVRNPDFDNIEDAALWILNARRLNYHASATTRVSLVSFPTDPDVIARSCLCRVRSRPEWKDVFLRELKSLRFDREDYRCDRIASAIDSEKAVKLSVHSLDDSKKSLSDLRQFEVIHEGVSAEIDLYGKKGWSIPAGIYSRLRMPVAVHAPRSNRRISSQSGVFTLHGGKLEPTPKKTTHDTAVGLPITIEEIEAGLKTRRVVKWLLIPRNRRASIRKTLAQIGVTDASLFPELEYQSRHLVSRWTYQKTDIAERA
jgi:hypothetical protein